MSRYISIDTYEDAETYLRSAEGLPDTLAGRTRKATYLRIAIVFAWVALEDVLKECVVDIAKIRLAPRPPRKIHDAMIYVIAGKQMKKDFDPDSWLRLHSESRRMYPLSEFLLNRRLRDDFVHANGSSDLTSLEDARRCLAYCKRMIEALAGFKMLSQWRSAGETRY